MKITFRVIENKTGEIVAKNMKTAKAAYDFADSYGGQDHYTIEEGSNRRGFITLPRR